MKKTAFSYSSYNKLSVIKTLQTQVTRLFLWEMSCDVTQPVTSSCLNVSQAFGSVYLVVSFVSGYWGYWKLDVAEVKKAQ
jgi:vacuolar-type H+-ATPase subunit I/STV1